MIHLGIVLAFLWRCGWRSDDCCGILVSALGGTLCAAVADRRALLCAHWGHYHDALDGTPELCSSACLPHLAELYSTTYLLKADASGASHTLPVGKS